MKVTVTCFSAENVSYSTRGGGILRNIFELMTSHMKYRFPQVPFCPFLLITGLKRVRLKSDCNTIAFPRTSIFHTVNVRDSVISLTGGFLS